MCMKLRVCFFYLQKKVNLNVTSYDSCVLQVIMMWAKKLITCVWYKPIKLCDMSLRSTDIHLFIDLPMSEYICTLYIIHQDIGLKIKERKCKKTVCFYIYLKTYYKVAFIYKNIRFIKTLFLLENKCSIKNTYLNFCFCCQHITITVLVPKLCLIYSIH